MQEGIPVVTVDNRLKTDKVAAHLATDNLKAGALAADQMVQAIKGHELYAIRPRLSAAPV
jgi:ribose transport system substrate-binding protein